MKKNILSKAGLAVGLVTTLTITSCQKDYTCVCKEYVNNVEQLSGGTTVGYKAKKSMAQGRCDSYEHTHYTGYNDTIAISWKCELK